MKINFTKKQFKNLTKLLFLGEWMFQSNKVEKDDDIFELEQFIYSQAKEFDLEDLVEFDSSLNQFLPSREFEEEMDPKINEYNDDTFWSSLTYGLAQSMMLRKYGQKKLEALPREELVKLQQEYIDQVSKEFEANGLLNLHLVNN